MSRVTWKRGQYIVLPGERRMFTVRDGAWGGGVRWEEGRGGIRGGWGDKGGAEEGGRKKERSGYEEGERCWVVLRCFSVAMLRCQP